MGSLLRLICDGGRFSPNDLSGFDSLQENCDAYPERMDHAAYHARSPKFPLDKTAFE